MEVYHHVSLRTHGNFDSTCQKNINFCKNLCCLNTKFIKMVNNNTPPQSPRTELLDEDGNEMIYIGDLDDIEDIGKFFLFFKN